MFDYYRYSSNFRATNWSETDPNEVSVFHYSDGRVLVRRGNGRRGDIDRWYKSFDDITHLLEVMTRHNRYVLCEFTHKPPHTMGEEERARHRRVLAENKRLGRRLSAYASPMPF